MEKRGTKQAPHQATEEKKRHLIALALLSVAVFLSYASSLTGTWALDDVLANKPVGLGDIRDLMGVRKVAYLTFLLNQSIAPFNPVSFRLFNILLHILNAALVYLLTYMTIIRVSERSSGDVTDSLVTEGKKLSSPFAQNQAFWGALISGIVFALHPININAVAYIIQRMTSLATFFVLLCLLSYSLASESGRGKALMLYFLSGLFLVLGIFSKENAVLAAPLVLLYDYVFLSRFDGRKFLKRAAVIGGIGILSCLLSLYLMGFHRTFFDLVKFLLNPHEPLVWRRWMAQDVYWTPLQHVLTEFRVVSRYLFLILIPLPKFLIFDGWGLAVSTGLTKPLTTLLSLMAVLSLFVFSLVKMRRFPLLCFGILWYLLSISLESFFMVGIDFYFEHRNYLPLSGLLVGIVGQIVISRGTRIGGKKVSMIVVALSLVLGSLTFSRNLVWKDSITLWEDTLRKNPSNLRAMMALGNSYLKASDFAKAERYYRDVLRVSSGERRLHFLDDSIYTLGMVYLSKGNLKDAKELISRYDSIIESVRPRILRGYYQALSGDAEGALKEYGAVLESAEGIDAVVTFTLMGDAYRGKGEFERAIRHYDNAISLDPGFSAAYYGKAVSHMGKREIDLAGEYFRKTLAIDPDNVLALSGMADFMLIKKSRAEDALAYARKAIAKSPPFYQPYLTMANVLIVLGNEKDAEDFYRKAIERGMSEYMIPFSKARAYYMRGDSEKTRYYLSELKKYRELPEEIKRAVK